MRDALATFALSQAITASAKSNIIDLKAIRDIAIGVPLYLWCGLDEAMTDAGSDSTIAVTLETDDAEAFGSATLRQTFGTFAALGALGKLLTDWPLLFSPGAFVERWARLDFTVANGNLTTGKVTAFITPNPQLWRGYARAGGPSF